MKRIFHTSAVGLGIVVAATVSGCGSLDANTGTAPTLATLEGQLTSTDSVDLSGGAVRIAVVWRTVTPGQFNVAEDLPAQPVFPSSFEIRFDAPPPAAAMNNGAEFGNGEPIPVPATGANGAVPGPNGPEDPVPSGTSAFKPFASPSNPNGNVDFALGIVVAYVDKNGNGKLDLVPEGASGYVDEIIGANQEMLVIYLQGTIPADAADAYGRLPTEGYNLVNIPACNETSLQANPQCTTPAPAGTCVPMQWFGMSQSYDLAITSDPEVADLMCLSSDDSSSSSAGSSSLAQPSSIQPTTYPSPCSPDLSCAPDGTSYYFSTCQTVSNGICQGTSENCSTVGYTRPTPTPSDWPCTH